MVYVSIWIIDIAAQFGLLLCHGEYEESRKITQLQENSPTT
jgi:hypothetical protein